MVVFSEKDVQAPDDNGFAEARFEKEAAADSELRQSIESAATTATSNADADSDFEESRSHLEELVRRNPGRSAAEIVSEALELDASMRRDPRAGTDRLMELYLQRGKAPKAEPVSERGPYGMVQTKLPNGSVDLAPEGSARHDIAKAMAQAKASEDYKAARAAFAKLYPGESFSKAVKEYLERDAYLRENPTYWAARVGRTYGLPLSAEEAQDYEARQRLLPSVQQEVQSVSSDSKNYPRFDELRPIMADIFRNANEQVSLPDAYQRAAKVADDVAAFKAKHPDFPKVRAQIQSLLNQGKANNLEEAYALATAKPKRGADDLRDDIRRAVKGRL